MWSVLNIDGRMLAGNLGGVRALLVDHTGCAHTASKLLAAARAAHREGGVQYCLVLPATPPLDDCPESGCAWELHVVREKAAQSPQGVPEHPAPPPAGLRLVPAVESRIRGHELQGVEAGRQAGLRPLRCELEG